MLRKFTGKSPITGRPCGQKKESVVLHNLFVAAIAAATLVVPLTASAQASAAPTTITVGPGQVATVRDVGPLKALPNQCSGKVAEVKAAEKTNCEGTSGAKWVAKLCFCDLSGVTGGDEKAFCRIEADRGSARQVHDLVECQIEARTVGGRAAAYYARREIDGDSAACLRVAQAAEAKVAPAPADVRACKENPGLRAEVKGAGVRIAAAEAEQKTLAGRVTAVEGRVAANEAAQTALAGRADAHEATLTALTGDLYGADEACRRVEVALRARTEPSRADSAACGANPGAVRQAKYAALNVDRIDSEVGELQQDAAALRKAFVLQPGLILGGIGQGEVRDGSALLRAGSGYLVGLQIRANVGGLRLVTTWARAFEDNLAGNDIGVHVGYMAWNPVETLKLGLGGGFGYRGSGQSPAFDAAGVQSFALQGMFNLEWMVAEHFAVTGDVIVGNEWTAARNKGSTIHSGGLMIVPRIGITFPISLL